jgi:hypothetical protein
MLIPDADGLWLAESGKRQKNVGKNIITKEKALGGSGSSSEQR